MKNKKFKDGKKKKALYILLLAIILISVSIYLFLHNIRNELNCKDYSYMDCPEKCVVCPPCEVCSSVSCQTEEFCNNIGFNRNWSAQFNKD